MAVVVCASATGAPGVTTTALGLALTWPRHVLLVDGDREPAQSIQAGYLRGMDHGGRGMMRLAQLHREGTLLAPELWRQTLPLVEGGDVQRRFLPGFTTPGAARLFEHVWPAFGEAVRALDGQGADVLVDIGRIGNSGLPLGLLASADAVLVGVRSSLRSLAAAHIHLPTLEDQLRTLNAVVPAALAVVGPARPYSTAEIAAQFGLPAWVEAPWDPKAAAVLSDGEPEPRRFAASSYMGRFRSQASMLQDRLIRARDVVAAGVDR